MKLAETVALSTRYATAGRVLSPESILDVAERADAKGLVLDASLPRDLLEPLHALIDRRRDQFPVLAMECPCPRSVREGAREPELCAPERDESDAALAAAVATVRRAGELRARFVIVGLGEVRPVARDWIHARESFLRDRLGAELLQRMSWARDDAAERALDQSRRVLDVLAREAERAGVMVAVRNGRRYIDVPSPRELDLLRADLRGAPIAPMLDVAAAHLTDVMGYVPMPLTLAAWDKPVACYFGDACGPIGALAPARGIVDLAPVKRALAESTAVAFSPWSGSTLDEIVAAVPSVKSALAA